MTPKQEAFVREYLLDLNATDAARRAGYSEKTADAIGKENLRKPPIAAAIAEAQAKRAERTEVTAEWVVQRLRIEATREGKGSSHAARVAACKTLAMHLGMLTVKHQHSGEVKTGDGNDERRREIARLEAEVARLEASGVGTPGDAGKPAAGPAIRPADPDGEAI